MLRDAGPGGRRMTAVAALLLAVSCAQAPAPQAAAPPPSAPQGPGPLPRSTPEEQGIRSADIRAFVDAMDARGDALHGFLLLRHGHVVAEAWRGPGAADAPHLLYSVTKSFTGTAVGMAVAEGKVDVDARVVDLFPDRAPAAPSAQLQAMRVRDLLSLSTGHEEQPPRGDDPDWVAAFLRAPVPREPGTHFVYNSLASHVLSAIVQDATGETLLDYLTPRLFEPLGIARPDWPTGPQGRSTGGAGIALTAEELAKFGQLYLQEGEWGGRRLLPASWVAQASTRHVSTEDLDWGAAFQHGYGWQFWIGRDDAYFAAGHLGQFCIVLPAHDAVIVLTEDTPDGEVTLDLVWEHLVPAFRAAPLPPEPEELAQLRALATVPGTAR